MSYARFAGERRRGTAAMAGFTLIELLIVVTLMSIVVLLALPTLSGNDITRLQAAAVLLQADLAYTQNESIVHGDDPRLMVFDTTNQEYHIAAASDPTTPIANPLDQQPYVVRFGEGRAEDTAGVFISAIEVGGDDQLRFGFYGETDQATTATVTLTSGGRSMIVSVDPFTGETTLSDIQ